MSFGQEQAIAAVQDEGENLAGVSRINFVGSGVSAAVVAGLATVTVSGSSESFVISDNFAGTLYVTDETFVRAVDATHPDTVYLPDQTQVYSPEVVPIGRAVWVLSVGGGTGISPMIGGSTYRADGTQTNPITSAASTLYLFIYRGSGNWLQLSWVVS